MFNSIIEPRILKTPPRCVFVPHITVLALRLGSSVAAAGVDAEFAA